MHVLQVVNHFSHFLLVNKVMTLMAPGSRIVAVSSEAHKFGTCDFSFWKKYNSLEEAQLVLKSGVFDGWSKFQINVFQFFSILIDRIEILLL